MRRSIQFLLVAALIVSILAVPGQIASAQDPFFDAEINKSFAPISIPAGGTSRLSVTIFNPNGFALTDASWSDNLVGVQSGLVIANPVSLTNSCNGTVSASAGGTTLSLTGGTVPPQVGSTPGACTVSVNVTSTSAGNKINTIPAGELTSTGDGNSITNTTPASATLNVTRATIPSVSKSFSPSTIWAGQTSQLSIVIRNNESGRSLTQVSITDDLPANVFLANPPNASTSAACGSSATVTAAPGGTSVTLDDGTIPPNSSCIITVSVTSDVQGRYTNRIPANALETQQGVTNNTPATASLNVRAIGLTKSFSPPTFSAGGTTTLNIRLQNPTGSAYTGARFTDNLPAPLTAVSVLSNSCGGAVSIIPETAVSLTGGTIPPGSPTNLGTCIISVQVTVPAGTAAGTLPNVIPVNGLTTDQNVGNLIRATANVTVTANPSDVAASKSFAPPIISAGANSRLRIEFSAPSDTDLTNFSITDNLPSGVTISNSTAATKSGSCRGGTLTAVTGAAIINWTGGTIRAGERCQINVSVTSSTVNTFTNEIRPGNITNTENRIPIDSITATLTVTGGGALAIDLVKGFDPLTVFGGSSSLMSIELINPGNARLTGIAFTDNMPNGMILANPVSFDVGSCGGALTGTPGSNSFSFSGGSLEPLGRCILTLRATMTVNGNLTNRIPAGAVTTDNGVSNADPVEATLTNLPGASVGKFFSPNPIPAGSYSLLTITIQNTGNIELTGMGLRDALPSGLVIAGGSAPAPVNNCGGSFVAVAGTQLVQLTDGVLAGNSPCTIVVPVTGSVAGDYENRIPEGALVTDPNVTNRLPAIDTLTITGDPGDPGVGGGGSGGRGRGGSDPGGTVARPGAFLIPVTGFAPGRATKLDAASRPAYGATSLDIEIPVIRVDTSIVGVESKNGGWEVAWLRDQVGWLNGTAYPTWQGNSVLTAHVVNADGKPGVFYRLKSLGVGEYIFVYNLGYRYTYKVVTNTYVQPDDATVMRHEEKSYLTLITCDTYDEETETYLRRVAVRAVLVDVRAAQ